MRNKKVLGCLFLLLICLTTIPFPLFAQEKEVLKSADSLKTITAVVDTTSPEGKKVKKINVYNPKKAALRSAILPGWGQVYNKKYWKLPIVYGALGITGYIFFDNINTYREYREAYKIRYKAALPVPDSIGYNELKEIYKIIEPNSIRAARDEFRRYIDYSVLFFILFWGLNVVDAAVDSHLKSFDVSPDLSFRFKPGHSEMAGTTGLSFVLSIGKKKPTTFLPSRF
ncbi:DUF5683 domain-containing protein [Terrimonas pollutisoli]|uniref:DUF5683 domain-containing protein n=1 Tax=Terrimonas pollutisoli TaxID=3034147 RepID=UPI0023EAD7E0|nr:DUF5683 domain-containing protein [Terrimonas sp. H1YJ31]